MRLKGANEWPQGDKIDVPDHLEHWYCEIQRTFGPLTSRVRGKLAQVLRGSREDLAAVTKISEDSMVDSLFTQADCAGPDEDFEEPSPRRRFRTWVNLKAGPFRQIVYHFGMEEPVHLAFRGVDLLRSGLLNESCVRRDGKGRVIGYHPSVSRMFLNDDGVEVVEGFAEAQGLVIYGDAYKGAPLLVKESYRDISVADDVEAFFLSETRYGRRTFSTLSEAHQAAMRIILPGR